MGVAGKVDDGIEADDGAGCVREGEEGHDGAELAETSLPPAAALSCMKAPVAFCCGTVPRTQASWTWVWAWAGRLSKAARAQAAVAIRRVIGMA